MGVQYGIVGTESFRFRAEVPDFGPLTEAIRAPLNHLRLLDHRLWQVPAVAYLYKHPDDGEQALKFFQMLERLAYAMMLHFTTASARQKRYQKLTQLIQGDKPLFVLNPIMPTAMPPSMSAMCTQARNVRSLAKKTCVQSVVLMKSLRHGTPV